MRVEEITEIIAKDIGVTGAIPRRMAQRITNLHHNLDSAITAYLAGEAVSFSLGDITLQTIMKKENCSLVEALFSMSTLLEKPEYAARYNAMVFNRDCVEG